MNRRHFTRFFAAPLLFFVTGTVLAGEMIDEIVVTADFRGRSVTELPASVSVLDAAYVEETAVQHLEELIDAIPNLNWSGDGHRARYFQIRGVGELEQYQGAPNPSVGFLIDDIDFSGIGTIATLFDVGSVEVLRGSQGSRYGANALGGLVYVRSTEPSAARDGRVEVTVGDDDARAIGVAFGGALDDAEHVLFRLSAQKHESNGFRKNTYLGRNDTNGRDETAVRLGLAFGTAGDLRGRVSVLYGRIDDGYDAFALDNSYTMLSDKPDRDAQESLGASLRLDWSDILGGDLTSITAFASSDINFGFDADWGNDDSWAPVVYDYVSLSQRRRDTLSQEVRYTTAQWLFGLYALHLGEDLATLNQGEYYDPGFGFADRLDYAFDSRYESTNVALFTQLDTELSDRTRVGAGLRVERRSTDYVDTDGFAAGPTDTLWGGEFSISRDVGDAAVVYAALSRGYKAGGFNLGPVPDNWRDFDGEAMWTLETGLKSSWLDDTLSLNASVFHAWREDQQVRASFQLIPNDPASFGFATINIDGGRSYGAEADLRWAPVEVLETYLSVGLLGGGFADNIEELPWLDGRDQAHAPGYTLAAGVAYRSAGGFFARVDVSAKDDFYFDVSHSQKSESYALVNARAGYETDDWRVHLWGRNLSNEYYAVRGFYFGNEPPDFPDTLYVRLGDPRHVGITIERRFN